MEAQRRAEEREREREVGRGEGKEEGESGKGNNTLFPIVEAIIPQWNLMKHGPMNKWWSCKFNKGQSEPALHGITLLQLCTRICSTAKTYRVVSRCSFACLLPFIFSFLSSFRRQDALFSFFFRSEKDKWDFTKRFISFSLCRPAFSSLLFLLNSHSSCSSLFSSSVLFSTFFLCPFIRRIIFPVILIEVQRH